MQEGVRLQSRLIRLAGLCLIGLVFAAPWAARAAERIDSFMSSVRINTDASLMVSETWKYDFDDIKSDSISKTMPLILRAKGDSYRISLGELMVRDELGTQLQTQLVYQGNNVTILFKPSKGSFSGRKTFYFSYKVFNAIRQEADWDVLVWPVVGAWNVGIVDASLQLDLPSNIPPEKVNLDCNYGAPAALKSCGITIQKTDRALTVEAVAPATLYAGENMIVTVMMPKHIVAFPTSSQEAKNFIAQNWPAAAPFIFFLFGLLWQARRRERLVGEAAYALKPKPPVDLSPLEMAALTKKVIDRDDLAAEIFWLATKGYLALQVDYSRGTGDYILVKKRPFGTMPNDFDRLILESLFTGQDAVYATVWLNNLPELMPQVINSVNSSLLDKGLIRQNRSQYLVLNSLLSALIMVAGWYTASHYVPGVVTEISLSACGPVYLFFALSALNKSKSWLKVQEDIESFENYLRSTSAVQQAGDHAGNQQLFEEYLAYALVLKVGQNWLNQFLEVPFAPPPWFYDSSWLSQVQYNGQMLLQAIDFFIRIVNNKNKFD